MGPWMAHIEASAQLVKIRGNKNSETELGRKLFLGTRLTYVSLLGFIPVSWLILAAHISDWD